tara:strand:- start:932 stop:1978 length:1047 start_codon:yes stop_codon:yes gene_type:complete
MFESKPYVEKIDKVNLARERLKKRVPSAITVKIPFNDLQAWAEFKSWRFVYDRQYLAEMQGLYNAVMPIEPLNDDKYPVILKPAINLYGMGHCSHLIMNKNDFHEKWGHTGFWSEYLRGPHYSYDLVLVNGKISWWNCFQGHYMGSNNMDDINNSNSNSKNLNSSMHGVFNSWENLGQRMLPNSIFALVKKIRCKYRHKRQGPVPNCGFYGCINIECIGDKIIEAHLRMGDIDQFEDDNLMDAIVRVYCRRGWVLTRTYKPCRSVHMFPIWTTRPLKLNGNHNNRRLRHRIIRICNRYDIFRYMFESDGGATPQKGLIRSIMLTGLDYDKGLKAQVEIYNLLKRYNRL